MKSDRRKASSSDPPTTGSSGDPRGYRSEIASPQASREPAIELGGPAIPLHPPRPLPLCMSVRRPARHRRQKPGVQGRQPVIHCTIPRKHRWAGAATPTQRNTTRPQEPPRRASDVINLFGKDNPRWPIGNATETIKVPHVGLPTLREEPLVRHERRRSRLTRLAGHRTSRRPRPPVPGRAIRHAKSTTRRPRRPGRSGPA
jgi:hypothetical protein